MDDGNWTANSTNQMDDLLDGETVKMSFGGVKQWLFTNFFVIFLILILIFIIILLICIIQSLIRRAKAKKNRQSKRRKPTLAVTSGSTLQSLTSSVKSIMSSNNPYATENNTEKSIINCLPNSKRQAEKSDELTLNTFSTIEHTIVGGELCEKRTRKKRIKAKTNEIDPKWVSNEPQAAVDDHGSLFSNLNL